MTYVVIVADKPILSRNIAEAMFRNNPWQGRRVLFVHMKFLGPYRFAYPRGLKWADYPHLEHPAYRCATGGSDSDPIVMEYEAGTGTVTRWLDSLDVPRLELLLRCAETIVFAADPHRRDYMTFKLMIDRALGVDAPRIYPRLNLCSYHEDAVQDALRHAGKTTLDVSCFNGMEAEESKRYFDFNYNLNAIAIHGETLRKVGGTPDAKPPSKFGLQLLYHLRALEVLTGAGVRESQLFRDMEHGKIGTGKYPKTAMGSPASRGAIIEQLIDSGLVERVEREGKPKSVVVVSELGQAFLNATHPGSEDADLAPRLEAWCDAGLKESQASMDRYLRTFFGRQKTFMARSV